jgi:hypothetical protein
VGDLNRLVELLANPKYQQRALLLFGFSDGVGSSRKNIALSKDRAKAVAEQLEMRGINPLSPRRSQERRVQTLKPGLRKRFIKEQSEDAQLTFALSARRWSEFKPSSTSSELPFCTCTGLRIACPK